MKYKIDEMSWQEFRDIKETTTVILPVASIEQHGPHLPLGVDAIISAGLGLELAKKIGGVVAPTIPYGQKPIPSIGTGGKYAGNIFVSGETLTRTLKEVLECFAKDGVKKIFVSEGHWENDSYILEAIEYISEKYPDVHIAFASWWNNISEEVISKVYYDVPFPGFGNSHAEVMETSMVLHFAPHLVDLEKIVNEGHDEIKKYYIYPVPRNYVPDSGSNAPALGSTPEKGKILVDEVVSNYVKIANELNV